MLIVEPVVGVVVVVAAAAVAAAEIDFRPAAGVEIPEQAVALRWNSVRLRPA